MTGQGLTSRIQEPGRTGKQHKSQIFKEKSKEERNESERERNSDHEENVQQKKTAQSRMVLRRFLNTMGHIMFTSVFLVSTSERGLETLPKPKNVFVNSTNMRHILRWSPVRVPLGDISYSVQFQGEFERNHKKTWVVISECSGITETWCDVTTDISSDVDYDLKVQMQLGNVTSKWANLSKLFNRKETNLTTPSLTVKVNGGLRTLDVSEVKNNINVRIYYWEKGVEQQIMNTSMDQNPYNIILQRGAMYCFQAQLYIPEYKKFGARSDPICESVNEDTTSNEILVMVTTVLLLGMSILAVSLFLTRKLCERAQSVWLPKVSAPYVPNFDNLPADIMKEEDHSNESCDIVQVLPQAEALLSVCQALTKEEKTNTEQIKTVGQSTL
ncbi:LOW QUALITY PROTEIN: interleukin-20 receptor subunit beta-like [Heterodontus francisci]|uniref:LOW QUALITY PROTEIN: interleukin-20 receptor subunit beta-like n=1 Tax=Heterodontus francisci TaxID=7792 RepID=UPI00355C886F